jgi:hypothetical protein
MGISPQRQPRLGEVWPLLLLALPFCTGGLLPSCTFAAHRNLTYAGQSGSPSNVIACVDAEGEPACLARCAQDPRCTNYGIYTVWPLDDGWTGR